MVKTTKWNEILGPIFRKELEDFAEGTLSGRQLYQLALDYGTPESRSAVRNLLRGRGVVEARRLARKALNRRSK